MMKDSFSGQLIPPGTGHIFVRKDGTILYFANRKTLANYLHLRRNPVKVPWTEIYHKAKATRMHAEKAKTEPNKPEKTGGAKTAKKKVKKK